MKRSALFAVLVVFVTLGVSQLAWDDARASNGAWEAGATVTEIPIPGDPYRVNRGNLDCDYKNLTSRYVTQYKTLNGLLTYDTNTIETAGISYPEICVVQNDHGLMGSGFIVPDLDTQKALPIDSGTYNILPAPSGSAVLFRSTDALGGLTYSVNYNMPYIGYLSTRTIARKQEKIWKIDTSKLEENLKYSDGTSARFDQVGFSSNGEWMVVQLTLRGFARINLQTKEMTPFYANSFINGTNISMTISNDGRYVASYRSGDLLLHDLTDCAQTYSYGNWPATGQLQQIGCKNMNYYNDVRSRYPLVEQISHLRFSPNGSRLLVDAGFRVAATGLFEWHRLQFDANNYQSSAQGYLAMGDSFSSGEGDTQGGIWYEPGTDEQGDTSTFAGRNLCHLSRRSYPYLLAVELGYLVSNTDSPPADGLFHSVACSGAKMHNITGLIGEKQDDGNAVDFAITDNQYRYSDVEGSLSGWIPGYEKQVGYINGRSDDVAERNKVNPEVITLSIGGNDVGFGVRLGACVLPGTCELATDVQKRSEFAIEAAQELANLQKVYKELKLQAPDAMIYVVGYPKFVQASPETCGHNVHLDNEEATFVNFAAGYFNEIIKTAAKREGVTFVDVENILANVNLCSGASDSVIAVNGVTAGNDSAVSLVTEGWLKNGLCIYRKCIGSETFHPNYRAQPLYRDAILSATNNLTLPNPDPISTDVPLPSDYFGPNAQAFVNGLNGNFINNEGLAELAEFIVGANAYRSPKVELSSLLPSSTVQAEIHSEPISLGLFTADQTGKLSLSLQLPDTLEPGYHEIHLYYTDIFGNARHVYQPLELGVAENDFDGDTILNDVDSCSTIIDSLIDVDEDGIDDACDQEALTPPSPPDDSDDGDSPPEEPPVEEDEDDELVYCQTILELNRKNLSKLILDLIFKRTHNKHSKSKSYSLIEVLRCNVYVLKHKVKNPPTCKVGYTQHKYHEATNCKEKAKPSNKANPRR